MITAQETFVLLHSRWLDYTALAGMLTLWFGLAASLRGVYRALRDGAPGGWDDAQRP